MRTWEYQIVDIGNADDPSIADKKPTLDKLGSEGWEAVSNFIGKDGGLQIIFKKQKPLEV